MFPGMGVLKEDWDIIYAKLKSPTSYSFKIKKK